MIDLVPPSVAAIGALGLSALAALFALLSYLAVRRQIAGVSREECQALLRAEGDAIRTAADGATERIRREIMQTLSGQHTAFIDRINGSAVALRDVVQQRLDAASQAQGEAARASREEMSASFQAMRRGVADEMRQMSDHQRERLEDTKAAIFALSETQKNAGEQLRATVEGRLDQLRAENTAELEKVRATVDEKLQTTLEARLGENFKSVIEHLNKAYEVFGEMRAISAHVGDLKNVLTNPKLRGTFGEVQLAMLLQDFLSPHQFIKDAQVKPNSAERVEYAIRQPMADGGEMLLPVDAKFPREDHEHMIEALQAGDAALVEHFRKQLENRIKAFAKDICRKYINPPVTTERAILFLPTESLFAEVLRIPGLFDYVQRECNVILAGPTTFAAILHAFQVNHRSMAIAQRSGDVWKILSAVRTEFKRYDDTVRKVAKQLNTAAGSVAELGKRTEMMDRALKNVETLPDPAQAESVLGLHRLKDDEVEGLPAPALASDIVLDSVQDAAE